jgi:hypothetical protein
MEQTPSLLNGASVVQRVRTSLLPKQMFVRDFITVPTEQ